MSRVIGIMQGRLSAPLHGRIQAFPTGTWQAEFVRAEEAGLQSIEWIYDVEDADSNPVASAEGIAEMRQLSKKHGVVVPSLCADYFMPRPFVRVTAAEWDERARKCEWLLGQCHLAGIRDVILPFVDNSRIATAQDKADVLRLLQKLKPTLQRLDMQIHLETSLGPEDFRSFMEEIGDPRILVNYDSGNSSSLGFAPEEEWNAYGKMIGSVHIKDRLKGGGTVALGTGNADFNALLRSLKKFNYQGRYILQVARGTVGEEVNWARQNRAWLEKLLAQTG
jgi:L-ribulose-5-phosphate 3-epimerase